LFTIIDSYSKVFYYEDIIYSISVIFGDVEDCFVGHNALPSTPKTGGFRNDAWGEHFDHLEHSFPTYAKVDFTIAM
jgi:hypothetical protein